MDHNSGVRRASGPELIQNMKSVRSVAYRGIIPVSWLDEPDARQELASYQGTEIEFDVGARIR